MRTKNAKRLWPVPATFAVMALAAFLAIGILAVDGNQPVAAQDDADCGIMVTGHQVPSADDDPVAVSASDPDPCVATGNMATIEFMGPSYRPSAEDKPIVLYVLVEDDKGDLDYYPSETIFQGNDAIDIVDDDDTTTEVSDTNAADISRPQGFYPGALPNDVTTGMAEAKSYSSMKVEVPLAEVEGGRYKAQSVTISVPGNFFVYTSSGPENGDVSNGTFADGYSTDIVCMDLNEDNPSVRYESTCDDSEASTPKGSEQLTDQHEDAIAVMVTLAAKPVLSVPDPTDDEETLPRSRWQMGDEDDVSDNKIEVEEADEVILLPTVQDAEENTLEGEISYEVEYHAESSLKAGQNLSYSVSNREYPDKADLTLDSWAGEGPFKATVKARFKGASGNLDLPDLTVFRAGPTVDITVVSCSALPEGEEDMNKKDGCEAGSDPDGVFPPDYDFSIVAKATDVVTNNTTAAATFSVKYPDDAQTEAGQEVFDGTFDGGMLEIAIHKDAPFGSYDIVVNATHGRGEDEKTFTKTVPVIVSGPPVTYEIMCDENVALEAFASAQCTITAMDAEGNIPDFDPDEMDNMVSVVVESDLNIRVTGLVDDMAELGDQTGTDMFTVYKPANAQRGDTISIGIFVGDKLQDQATITFGEPFMAPGMPMNVMAEATSYSEVTVSWESPAAAGDSNITGYMVQSAYMMADDMMSDWMDVDPAHMSMDMMYMDMGLMAETTYYYRVAAMNSVGMGEYSDGTAMAMTMAMMMPSMELGAPSITNVMSDADGMATVMLMPGDNATKHWVWAAPTDRSEGMWHGDSALAGDATMVTFSGLTSDMNYWFIAVAGRGTGADSEWSDWSGWTAASPIQ